MNYITILNRFYDFIQENEVSSKAQHLYSTLLLMNNKTNWSDWFGRTNISLCGIMGISEKALVNARKELQEFGLIDFTTSKKRGESTQYHIIDTAMNHQRSKKEVQKESAKEERKGSTEEEQNKSTNIPKTTPEKTGKARKSNNKFNQFPQRDYTQKELADMERDLLNKNSLCDMEKETTESSIEGSIKDGMEKEDVPLKLKNIFDIPIE